MKAEEMRHLGFRQSRFEHGSKQRRVFMGGSGPGVLLMHELAGIGQPVAAFGRFLVDSGFTVWMPYLFGGRDEDDDRLDGWGPGLRACLSREFVVLAVGKNSPITDWLRALARQLYDSVGGPGVAVVGMCMTGGFALSVALEPNVLAALASQPSLPVAFRPSARRDSGVEPCALGTLRLRIKGGDLDVGALRFSKDLICPSSRVTRLKETLGRLAIFEIQSGGGTPFGRFAHAVLTEEHARHPDGEGRRQLDDARRAIVDFLEAALAARATATGPGSLPRSQASPTPPDPGRPSPQS